VVNSGFLAEFYAVLCDPLLKLCGIV
jgi:hypothetical protein